MVDFHLKADDQKYIESLIDMQVRTVQYIFGQKLYLFKGSRFQQLYLTVTRRVFKEAVISNYIDIPFFLASFFAFFDNALGFPILATISGTMFRNTTVW